MLHPISVLLSLLLLGGSPADEDPTIIRSGCEYRDRNAQEYTIAFWNWKISFDYEDDPDNPDDEYLPRRSGTKHATSTGSPSPGRSFRWMQTFSQFVRWKIAGFWKI